MATRTFKSSRDESMLDFQPTPESAPSIVRKESTLAAQVFLFIGFFLTVVGSLALAAPLAGWGYFLSPAWGYPCLTVGIALILYHCYVDRDRQFRLIYTMLGFALLAAGLIIRIFPSQSGMGPYFLSVGVPLLFLAPAFLVGVLQGETDPFWRRMIRLELVGLAAVGLIYAVIRGFFNPDFLTTEGILVILLGLVYFLAFAATAQGESEGDIAHRATITLGIGAAATFALAVLTAYSKSNFLIPQGVILGGIGLVVTLLAFGSISDRPTLVVAQRELLSYFFSPVAYLVLFGLVCIFGFNFLIYLSMFVGPRGPAPVWEPILERYVYSLFPVVAVVILVPILTMRLLSEERGSGSLELLLTAPVDEWSVVLGKFLAAWVFFLIAWIPYFLFLVALRIFADAPAFDYRPVLSFMIALALTGAAFVAMGMFFSSLTSNQLIAAVLTFAAMLLALGFHWMRSLSAGSFWQDVFTYVSFLDLWQETSRGYVPLRYFAVYAAATVFFLFLTTLALSSRKWK